MTHSFDCQSRTREVRCPRLFAALATFGLISAAAVPAAPAHDAVFVPFADFRSRLTTADPEQYVRRSASSAQDIRSFEQMRQHLLRMYDGVSVVHSFELDTQIFDCVPLMQQPGVRLAGLKALATPPPPLPIQPDAPVQVRPGSRDAFGNLQHCDIGTIPMRRLTLQELSRFKTLQQFLQKSPAGGDALPIGAPHDPNGHSYAQGKQDVDNYGGFANLTLWSPKVKTGKGETFSLSQEWYVGGTGNGFQSAETGWIVDHNRFHSSHGVLFIYFTPDNYGSGGCWNLDCPAFVQNNNSWILGARFSNYSKVGKAQYSLIFGFERDVVGNWWLQLGSDWVGYYPYTVYNGGQLTQYAQSVAFGGEVCCLKDAHNNNAKKWAEMGSGEYAVEGFKNAAYDRNIFYRDFSYVNHDPTLYPYTPSPACYTYSGSYSSDWKTYFYFGGPGGDLNAC